MDLSIIIPSYNTKDLLDRCLSSIVTSLDGSTLQYEIIVVDNASKDGTIGLLNKKYPRVHKIFNKENIGFGKANNVGIKSAHGKTILLLNSDIKVEDQAVEKLVRFIESHPRSFAGGKLLNEDHSPQPSSGPQYNLPVVFAMLFLRADSLHLTRYSPDKTKKVAWVSGACLGGTKEAFLDTGLFDERIFMYMEEIDLLYRARQKGYTVFFYPDARFIHTGAASSGSHKTPVINIFRGLRYFYTKHKSIMELRALNVLLWLKATLAIVIGTVLGKRDLVDTYEQANFVDQR